MRTRWVRRMILAALLAGVQVACGGGPASSPGTSDVGALPVAGDFEGFAASACSALQSIWRGYGNPDTASLSPLQREFVDAVERGDATAADAHAAEVRAELERGRAAAMAGRGWAQGAEAMIQMDRLLLAFEAMVEATRAATPLGSRAATDQGQAAFEAAGGIEAWRGMLRGIGSATQAAGAPWPACEGIPIS